MSYVVVGAGLAGAKAVQTLREEGFTGDIHLVGEEGERPYERPPLSKGFLLGKQPIDSVFVHEAHWYVREQRRPSSRHAGGGIGRRGKAT